MLKDGLPLCRGDEVEFSNNQGGKEKGEVVRKMGDRVILLTPSGGVAVHQYNVSKIINYAE